MEKSLWLIAMFGQRITYLADSKLYATPQEAAAVINENRKIEWERYESEKDPYVPLEWDEADDLWQSGSYLIISLVAP